MQSSAGFCLKNLIWNRGMDRQEIYRELENEFVAALYRELMTGVLHNFANPLNSLMGRSRLLQRRWEDLLRKMEDRNPELAGGVESEKIKKDIGALVSEADRFYDIFQNLAGKFSILSHREQAKINVAKLMEAEVRFADFYLDFKRNFKKNLQLDDNLPEIMGNAADFSLCFSEIITSARLRMKDSPVKEISISVRHDANSISLTVQDKGSAISDACRQQSDKEASGLGIAPIPEIDQGLYYALLLLGHNGVTAHVDCGVGGNVVSLNFPLSQEA